MSKLFEIFENLLDRNKNNPDGIIETASIPGIKNHKIGISENIFPTFFIKCKGGSNQIKQLSLKIISVNINIRCQLYANGKLIDDANYAQVILKSESWEMKKYFIDIISTILPNFNDEEDGNKVKDELDKVVNLFSKLNAGPKKSIQGLWAELLLINMSDSPDYLINAWHISSNDKYDFNDGCDKIEVKSTEKTKRAHNFSIEQLTTTQNSNLIIASFLVYESGIGTTVFDLSNSIKSRINDVDTKIKLDSVIAECLGTDFELAFEKYFDNDYGIENLKLYQSNTIPSISIKDIPSCVSEVKFVADLTAINSINEISYKSKLHELLKIPNNL